MNNITTKILTMSFIALFVSFSAYAQPTVLSAGDIAFTGFHADNPDDFSFILLTDVNAGTKIRFTDCGWENDNTFRFTEGFEEAFFFTNVACGTEIYAKPHHNTLSAMGNSVGTIYGFLGSFSLSDNGDQILAFQGHTYNPHFIAAIHFKRIQWLGLHCQQFSHFTITIRFDQWGQCGCYS